MSKVPTKSWHLGAQDRASTLIGGYCSDYLCAQLAGWAFHLGKLGLRNALGKIMADKPRLSSKIRGWMQTLASSEIRDWVQTLAIVAGVGVGLWQFWFKEILTPAAAPINLTTEVTLKEAGFSGAGSGESKELFEAIELTIVAKNPSTRDVYLLGNCWYARGFAIRAREENKDWAAAINERITPDALDKKISGRVLASEGAYYDVQKTRVVAANAVFTDIILHPNESISSSFVIFVPQNMYDVLHVVVQLPTTAVDEAAQVWTVTDTDNELDPGCNGQLFRKRSGIVEKITDFFRKRNGIFEEIKDTHAAFLDRTLQYQIAKSTRELSLWQSKPPSTAATKPSGTLPRR